MVGSQNSRGRGRGEVKGCSTPVGARGAAGHLLRRSGGGRGSPARGPAEGGRAAGAQLSPGPPPGPRPGLPPGQLTAQCGTTRPTRAAPVAAAAATLRAQRPALGAARPPRRHGRACGQWNSSKSAGPAPPLPGALSVGGRAPGASGAPGEAGLLPRLRGLRMQAGSLSSAQACPSCRQTPFWAWHTPWLWREGEAPSPRRSPRCSPPPCRLVLTDLGQRDPLLHQAEWVVPTARGAFRGPQKMFTFIVRRKKELWLKKTF